MNWNHLSCISFVVRTVLQNISPQFNSAKSWFHLHTLLGIWLYSFWIEYTPLEPHFKITDHGFESESRGRALFSLTSFVFCFYYTSLLMKPICGAKIQSHVWKPFMKMNKRHFPLHPLNVLPLSHSFKTSIYHDFLCLSQYENYSV